MYTCMHVPSNNKKVGSESFSDDHKTVRSESEVLILIFKPSFSLTVLFPDYLSGPHYGL